MKVLAALIPLLLAGSALAGTAESPEVTDPAADAGPNGAAAPAGFEDVDFTAVWFEGETDSTLDLVMKVGAAPRGRPNTIWGQIFEVNGTQKAAAYFDFQPFGSGGQLCDWDGTNPINCMDVEGTAEGDKLRVRLPRVNISDPAAGQTLTLTGGAAFSVYFIPSPVPVPVGGSLVWDTTDAGLPYLVTKGVRAAAEGAENLTGPAANTTITPTGSPQSMEPNETPFPALLALATAGLAAFVLRRR